MTSLVDRIAVALLGILLMIGFAIACAPEPLSEDDNPDGVRVQHYDGQPPFNQGCLVFTHDTSQGASVAVVCK